MILMCDIEKLKESVGGREGELMQDGSFVAGLKKESKLEGMQIFVERKEDDLNFQRMCFMLCLFVSRLKASIEDFQIFVKSQSHSHYVRNPSLASYVKEK